MLQRPRARPHPRPASQHLWEPGPAPVKLSEALPGHPGLRAEKQRLFLPQTWVNPTSCPSATRAIGWAAGGEKACWGRPLPGDPSGQGSEAEKKHTAAGSRCDSSSRSSLPSTRSVKPGSVRLLGNFLRNHVKRQEPRCRNAYLWKIRPKRSKRGDKAWSGR